MTLLAFIIGIVLITLIARYNESNKLFWSLLVCYVLGFTGVKLYIDNFTNNESKVKLEQVQPTQGLIASSGSLVYLLADESTSTNKTIMSKPVSQAIDVPVCNRNLTSSVSGVTPRQTVHILPNPPTPVAIIDDS